MSVDPILDRTFFRSGAEALLAGRGGLDTVLAFAGAFAVVGFLASAVVAVAVAVAVVVAAGLGVAGLGLGRLAAPGTAAVPAPGLTALPVALFGRLTSAAAIGWREEGKRWVRALRMYRACSINTAPSKGE